MKRLKRLADEEQDELSLLEETNEEINQEENLVNDTNFEIVKNLLQRIGNNAEDIKSTYYVLLENLNALNKDFPDVYNELKVMVKLPNKNNITDISNFKEDMSKAEQMLCDQTFLSGLIK